MKKDLLSIYELEPADFELIWEKSKRLKKDLKEGKPHASLKGKTLGMIFDKSSTRTRISFEVGMYQLGGIALFLNSRDTQISRGEIIADSAPDDVALFKWHHDSNLCPRERRRTCQLCYNSRNQRFDRSITSLSDSE